MVDLIIEYEGVIEPNTKVLKIYISPVSGYSRQLARLNNILVIRSSPESTAPTYVGLTILRWVSGTDKPTSGTGRQAFTDNVCCVKEEEDVVHVAWNSLIKILKGLGSNCL